MLENITCRIWAHEISPSGHEHYCHAESIGLEGNSYPKNNIQNILDTKPNWGGTWKIVACEPNHDGEACKDCIFRHCKGLSHYFDPTKQRTTLKDSKLSYVPPKS